MELDKAEQVVQGLKEAGINFAVGLPDSQFHEIYEMITQDPALKYVGVGNEGAVAKYLVQDGPSFVVAKIEPVDARERKGGRGPGVATQDTRENKYSFVHHVERLENITILKKGGGG
jgi:hypothetical protein